MSDISLGVFMKKIKDLDGGTEKFFEFRVRRTAFGISCTQNPKDFVVPRKNKVFGGM